MRVSEIINSRNLKDMVELYPAWNLHARESDEGLHLVVDMPGLGKKDVRVSLERSTTLIIEGEGKDDGVPRLYSSRVDLSKKLFEVSQIKAEMSNGALKVFVPYVKHQAIVITVD